MGNDNEKSYNKAYYAGHRGAAAVKARAVAMNKRRRKVAAMNREAVKLDAEAARIKADQEHIKARQAEANKIIKKRRRAGMTPEQDKTFIDTLTKTGSKREAMQAARPGINERAASAAATKTLERPEIVNALLAAHKAAGLDETYLTKKLKEGLDAKETKFFAHNGVVQDTRDTIDYGTRKGYLELAHKIRKDLVPDQAGTNTGAIIINVTEIKGMQPAEVVDAEEHKG